MAEQRKDPAVEHRRQAAADHHAALRHHLQAAYYHSDGQHEEAKHYFPRITSRTSLLVRNPLCRESVLSC